MVDDLHGTAVASILTGDTNGFCSVGIAPKAFLSSCNLYSIGDAAYVFSTQLQNNVDVSSNSWNPKPCNAKADRTLKRTLQQQQCQFTTSDANPQIKLPDNQHPCTVCPQGSEVECRQAARLYCSLYYELDPLACSDYLDTFVSCEYHALPTQTQEYLVQNIVEGRQGLGVIFVFPAGDEYGYGSDANLDGFSNSRLTITVGAVGKDGKHASYSTPGACVFVSAPGGDKEYISNNIVAMVGGGCRDAGYGTGYAVPVVAGVAALMLQVNNELGWRDVQAILAETARKVNTEDSSWTTNAAGISHSYKYGFGIVDAEAAVSAARSWTNYAREELLTSESETLDLPISDDPQQLTVSSLDVELNNGYFFTESVVIYVDLVHASRGDLELTLISPNGTESLLAPSKRPENTVYVEDSLWKFTTFRTRGEDPRGTWQLQIKDERAGILEECIDLDWTFSYDPGENGGTETLTCYDFRFVTDCHDSVQVNPVVLEVEHENRTVLDACCPCGGGIVVKDTVHLLKSWSIVVYGRTLTGTETGSSNGGGGSNSGGAATQVPTSNCNFMDDKCPFEKQFDHVCQADVLDSECAGGDCVDCDGCRKFDYDCNGCIKNGCVWW